MPVYNTPEQYLRKAIDSVLGQTFSDFEFIIVNDGSTSSTPEKIIQSYKDVRIKYFKTKNGGISAATNFGIAQAAGEYIALHDHDDISRPDRFVRQVEFLDNNPDISAVGAWIQFFGTSDLVMKDPPYPCFLDMLKSMKIRNMVAMFRHDIVKRYGLKFDESDKSSAGDYDFWLRFSLHGKVANIQSVLLDYRYHDTNASVVSFDKNLARAHQIHQNMMDLLTPCKESQKQIRKIMTGRRWVGIPVIRIKSGRAYLFGLIPITLRNL